MKAGKRLPAVLLVLACLMGAVAPAHAAGSSRDSQEYTDTRQPDCVLAVRADVFEGFAGVVEVSIQDEYGKTADCDLTAENGYACNLRTAQGSCSIKASSAHEGDTFYEVKRLASRIRVSPGEIAVCRLVVSDYEIPKGDAEEIQETEVKERDKEDMMEKYYENVQASTGKKNTNNGRISVLLWLAALAGAAVYWYLRYGKKKRHGR